MGIAPHESLRLMTANSFVMNSQEINKTVLPMCKLKSIVLTHKHYADWQLPFAETCPSCASHSVGCFVKGASKVNRTGHVI